MKYFSKAFFVIICFVTGVSYGQKDIMERKGMVFLDTTLNPEKYEARYIYTPSRPIIRVRNTWKNKQIFVKIVGLLKPSSGQPLTIALSRRAYQQFTSKPSPQPALIQFQLDEKLSQDLKTMPEGISRIDTLNRLSKYLLGKDVAKSQVLAQEALQLSQKLRYLQGQAVAYQLLARVNKAQSKDAESKKHLLAYIATREQENKPQKMAWAYSFAMEYFEQEAKLNLVLQYAFKWLKLTKDYKNRWDVPFLKRRISKLYQRLVNFHFQQGKNKKVQAVFEQWKSFETREGNRLHAAYYDITNLYDGKPEGERYYQEWKAWINRASTTKVMDLGRFYSIRINRNLRNQQFTKATREAFALKTLQRINGEEHLKKILNQVRSIYVPLDSLEKFLGTIRRNSGKLYKKYIVDTRFYYSRQGRSSLRKRDPEEADLYYQQLVAFQKNASPKQIKWAYGGIAGDFAQFRHWDKAIIYHQKLIKYLEQQKESPVKLREAKLYLSVLYRNDRKYVQSLEVLIGETQKGGAFPEQWLRKTVDRIMRRAPMVRTKRKFVAMLKQWRTSFQQKDDNTVVKQIDTQLKRLE